MARFHLNSNSIQVPRLVDQKLQYLGWNWSGLHSPEENRKLSVRDTLFVLKYFITFLLTSFLFRDTEREYSSKPLKLNIALLNVF